MQYKMKGQEDLGIIQWQFEYLLLIILRRAYLSGIHSEQHVYTNITSMPPGAKCTKYTRYIYNQIYQI